MAKITKTETNENGKSYRIDFGGGMVLWFDAWKDAEGEITGDWNKYIFFLNDPEDVKIKAFQEANSDEAGAYNFATALELVQEAWGENTIN